MLLSESDLGVTPGATTELLFTHFPLQTVLALFLSLFMKDGNDIVIISYHINEGQGLISPVDRDRRLGP